MPDVLLFLRTVSIECMTPCHTINTSVLNNATIFFFFAALFNASVFELCSFRTTVVIEKKKNLDCNQITSFCLNNK